MIVELHYNSELKRFPFKGGDVTFYTLVSMVHSKFPDLLDYPITLTCEIEDEDGKSFSRSLSSDEEIANVLQLVKNDVLRIFIERHEKEDARQPYPKINA